MNSQREPRTIKVHEAKTQFSRFLKCVELGDEFVIANGERPVARLVPYDDDPSRLEKRVGGQDKGKVWISPDFDSDSQVIEMFYGEDEEEKSD